MSGSEELVREWLTKADEDELSARAVLKEGAPSTACFLAQQIAEKHLKALLIARGMEFPKTHDLVELAELTEVSGDDLTSLRDEFKTLGPYAVEVRYPSEIPSASLRAAQEAFAAALRVKEFVRERLRG